MSKTVDDILADMEPQMAQLRNRPVREADRIPEILALIQDVWTLNPDLRLGQLLVNFTGDRDPYLVEDSTLAKLLTEYLGPQE